MKKLTLPLIALFMGINAANAVELDANEAVVVAKNFYSKNSKLAIKTTTLAHVEISEDDEVLFYVFNINENDGYVIVPADDNETVSDYSRHGRYVQKDTETEDTDTQTVIINSWTGSSWAIM